MRNYRSLCNRLHADHLMAELLSLFGFRKRTRNIVHLFLCMLLFCMRCSSAQRLSSKSHQSTLFHWMHGPSDALTSKDKASGDDGDRCSADKSQKMQVHGRPSLSAWGPPTIPWRPSLTQGQGVPGLPWIRIYQKPCILEALTARPPIVVFLQAFDLIADAGRFQVSFQHSTVTCLT